MKPKRRRLYFVGLGLLLLAAAAALALTALQDNVVFFYSPTELAEKKIPPGQRVRLGGLVLEKSIQKQADGVTTAFGITDGGKTVNVVYKGLLPDLFREGQGVVVQGTLRPDGIFVASEVLAKHDENYMPPEVAEALKKNGMWKEPKPK